MTSPDLKPSFAGDPDQILESARRIVALELMGYRVENNCPIDIDNILFPDGAPDLSLRAINCYRKKVSRLIGSATGETRFPSVEDRAKAIGMTTQEIETTRAAGDLICYNN